jgi:hypothetical protein
MEQGDVKRKPPKPPDRRLAAVGKLIAQSGQKIARVTIDKDGQINLIMGLPASNGVDDATKGELNEWDARLEELEKAARRE